MDWSDSPGQATFRSEVRAFIADKLPAYYQALAAEGRDPGWRGGWRTDRVSEDDAVRPAAHEWAEALREQSWIAAHWPTEYGGAGLSTMEQFILNSELASANAPAQVGGSTVTMLGPTIIAHGSEEQQRKYLPEIFAGEISWAQGYSEPGAGSDLGSLQTRAVRDGDDYILNGQKIWTSGAHLADSIFMLVRTDPDAPKHRGITFLLVDDIRAPGITVRPLINMAWEHGFNETFFEDVRVPINPVGEENRGWYVGMTLLDFERSSIGGAIGLRRDLARLVDALTDDDTPAPARLSPTVRSEIADRVVEAEVGYNFSFRIVSTQTRSLLPNYEASMGKMYLTELMQRCARTGMRALGLYAGIWDEDDPRCTPTSRTATSARSPTRSPTRSAAAPPRSNATSSPPAAAASAAGTRGPYTRRRRGSIARQSLNNPLTVRSSPRRRRAEEGACAIARHDGTESPNGGTAYRARPSRSMRLRQRSGERGCPRSATVACNG